MNNYSYKKIFNKSKIKSIKDVIELEYELSEINISEFYDEIKYYKELYNGHIGNYYRNTIYKKDKFEIVLIYWCPYSYSRVHYHPNRGCLMKVLEGYLEIDIYDDSDYSTIQHISYKILNEGSIEYIRGRHGIHRISNEKNNEPSITLHLYMY